MAATAPSLVPSFGDYAESVHVESAQYSSEMTLANDVAQAYNEEAFRYFLEIERKRSESSNRPLLLLLVDLKSERSTEDIVDGATAGQLFSGLSACLRETDFVGWYRENRVVGAVLTQRASTHRADTLAEISDRVAGRLAGRVSDGLLRRMQLRVFQLPGRVDDEHQN